MATTRRSTRVAKRTAHYGDWDAGEGLSSREGSPDHTSVRSSKRSKNTTPVTPGTSEPSLPVSASVPITTTLLPDAPAATSLPVVTGVIPTPSPTTATLPVSIPAGSFTHIVGGATGSSNNNNHLSFDNIVKDSRKSIIQIPVNQLKVGDIVSATEFRKISWVSPTFDKFKFVNLREDAAQREWVVTSSRPYQCCSANAYSKTIKVNKSDMAKRFMSVHDDVFTVKFMVNFSREKLAAELQAIQNDMSNMSALASTRDYNRLADRMLASSERTVIGRLVSSDAALGYSLIDDLGKTNPKANHLANFNSVNHREILELIVRDVRYVRA